MTGATDICGPAAAALQDSVVQPQRQHDRGAGLALALKRSAVETCAADIRFYQVGLFQIGLVQIGCTQAHTIQNRLLKVGVGEIRSRQLRAGEIRLRARIDAGELPRLMDPAQIKTVLDQLMRTDWVVYTKACLKHTDTVVDYLARYSHRIALADQRLGSLDRDGRVALQYTDYRDDGRHKVMMLDGVELIRRFLLHVLPKGFMRIRHYGFLANRCRRRRLAQIREAIAGQTDAVDAQPAEQDGTATPFDGYPCPQCQHGRLRVIGCLAPQRLDGG